MKTVLAISSEVVRGHVGLGAIRPTLTAMGVNVLALPSVLISNHPGHRFGAGLGITPAVLEEMVDALDANGWLGEVDAVISGYLPTAEHVEMVRRLVHRMKGLSDVLYLCDPVIGDGPKGLYVEEDAAATLRSGLVDMADVITPNAFELGWLAGADVTDVASACAAAARLDSVGAAIVTSVPAGEDHIANVLVENNTIEHTTAARREGVPNGTGDLFAALVLGHLLAGATPSAAMERASAGVGVVIDASIGESELKLVQSINSAIAAELHKRAVK